MATEPQTPKRTTRSTTAASTTPQPKPTTTSPLSIPTRTPQLQTLLTLLGPPTSPSPPLLLHGGPSTGKTHTLLHLLRHLARPFAYASLRSHPSPSSLFRSLLSQLSPHPPPSSLKPPEFVSHLRSALASGDGTVYLVFDNVELVSGSGKLAGIVSLLFRLGDVVRMPRLGLIYVSRVGPEVYYGNAGSVEPISVFFPDYTEEEVCQILVAGRDNVELYSSFLKVALKAFFRVTRRIDELSVALEPLFEKYCESLSDLSVVPDEALKRRLFDKVQPHIVSSLNETFIVASRFPKDVGNGECNSRKRKVRKLGWEEGGEELDFHMSVSAKYLLISAFLASRNPATLDAAMFDSMGGQSNQKRKRKSSEASIQQKEEKANEMLMKGPGSFSLERLLVLFECITSVSDGKLDDDELALKDDPGYHDVEATLMSDVLLQLSTLCNANFISKGSSLPLDCSTRYRSRIDEDLALKVARSVRFPLSKYLYRC